MSQRFDKDDRCKDCGCLKEIHPRLEPTAERWWPAWRCPDLSLPDPNRDDDPWEPVTSGEDPPVAKLFDSYT